MKAETIGNSPLYILENENSILRSKILKPIFQAFEIQLNQLRAAWFSYPNGERDLFNQNEVTYCGMWTQSIREAFPNCIPIIEAAVYHQKQNNSVGRIDCLAKITLDDQPINLIIEAKQWPYDGKKEVEPFDKTKEMYDRIAEQANNYFVAETEYYNPHPTYLVTLVFEYLSSPAYVLEMLNNSNWDPYTHFFKVFHLNNCGMMVYGQFIKATLDN